jgi:hypothetical protein
MFRSTLLLLAALLSVSVQAQQKPVEPAPEKSPTQSSANPASAAAKYFPNLIIVPSSSLGRKQPVNG